MFNTYIEDRAMIPVLLGYDWIIVKDTWTDCCLLYTSDAADDC